MKGIFTLLASVSGLFGIIQLLLAMFTWNLALFFAATLALVNSYAWSLVGDIWEKVEYLERQLKQI